MAPGKGSRKKGEKDEGRVSASRLEDVLDRSHRWLQENKFKKPACMVGRVQLMVMVGGDYISGRYRRVPAVTIWTMAFALLYLLSPIDLIPDMIPGMGWLDDAFIVGLVFRAVSHDLRRYCEDNEIEPKRFGL